ncbi:hypothetical protein SETIT_5G135200v2 [Setaria italica]|uniref:Uncharacterized protein n=1 Tax=Setaria italica TaxID=4555 RepID=A0A368R4C5_SETIT|nr:hypothetical protein SETIT_5G135200v2 [Setaria italica]
MVLTMMGPLMDSVVILTSIVVEVASDQRLHMGVMAASLATSLPSPVTAMVAFYSYLRCSKVTFEQIAQNKEA